MRTNLYHSMVFILGLMTASLSFAQQSVLQPTFDGADSERKQISVGLRSIADGFRNPTTIVFIPGQSSLMAVFEKNGQAWLLDLKTKQRHKWFLVDVATQSELGLLGLAFHPQFQQNGKFYVNYTPQPGRGRQNMTRVSEWQWDRKAGSPAKELRSIFEVAQPYVNHNAGDLQFGPDGFLYIGLGDGGSANDPENRAQNPKELLGKMLRIDVNEKSPGKNYGIPKDNPFINEPRHHPETFALGLRNPWRYSFDKDGRLIVADVGQNLWEKVSFVPRGANLGWNILEASHCFTRGLGNQQTCQRQDLALPIAEYGRNEGISITGGFQYLGSKISELKDKYVFGDFGSGRLWAISLPPKGQELRPQLQALLALGKWNAQIVSFAKDDAGELYVLDFGQGRILAIEAPE
jgi:glucose/arabinose dehydrogenase